jgi:hypothetical protein
MKRFHLSWLLFFGSLVGVSAYGSGTEEFRPFLYRFFNEPSFQLDRVQFPLLKKSIVFDGEKYDGIKEEMISRAQWKHVPGPDQYRCKTNCFDVVFYDNFERKFRESKERVVAFEGVGNGINAALYFRLENEKWKLIKYEDLSN